jgi:hypothetical protein
MVFLLAVVVCGASLHHLDRYLSGSGALPPPPRRHLAFTGAGIRGTFSGTFDAATQKGMDPPPLIAVERGRVDVTGHRA